MLALHPYNVGVHTSTYRVPILQFPGEPERAGEARRADSASGYKAHSLGQNGSFHLKKNVPENKLRTLLF